MGFFLSDLQKEHSMKAIQLNLFKPSNQLDFFQGDGYVIAYGEDARLAAKNTGGHTEWRDGNEMFSFSLLREADTILPRLVKAGFKIKLNGI